MSHYSVEEVRSDRGMDLLRTYFPQAKADPLNFVLFSTSGVHGSYSTIEDVESDQELSAVTFLVILPRMVRLICGNAIPETPDDFDFLKRLRASSWEIASKIGR